MSINDSQLFELQKFVIGSFAIWADVARLEKNLSSLHANVIFLGLNRSGKIKQ